MIGSRVLMAKSELISTAKNAAKPELSHEYFMTRDARTCVGPAYNLSLARPRIFASAKPELVSGSTPLPLPIQAKLEIGSVDDPLELEADNVATQITRMPGWKVSGTPITQAINGIQRKCSCGGTCDACKDKDADEEYGRVQRMPTVASRSVHTSSALSPPPLVHEVLRAPGQPLDPATRAFFEPRFGHDFSRIRVHTDAKAAESAKSINARAYTVGHQIVFGAKWYAPATDEGAKLLAHELTHVMQQSGGANKAKLRRDVEVKADPGATCSLEQHRHIEPAAYKANEWLAITLGAINSHLSGAKTPGAQAAQAALTKHFHSTDTAVVTYVRDRLQTIQSDLFGRRNFRVNCPPASDRQCGTKHGSEEFVAVVPSDNPNEINLCQQFFERGVDDCASTIIHEFGHTQLGLTEKQSIVDRGYKWDKYYPYLTTGETLINAESYAMLAREIATGSSPAPAAISDDIGKSCPKDWVPLITDAMMKARAWNHRAAISTPAGHEFSLVYKKLDGTITSEIGFKCILDGGGRCPTSDLYWYFAGDLRVCPSWRQISSPDERAIEMLATLYGYKGVMSQSEEASEKRRRAAQEAQRLHSANVPSTAEVLRGK